MREHTSMVKLAGQKAIRRSSTTIICCAFCAVPALAVAVPVEVRQRTLDAAIVAAILSTTVTAFTWIGTQFIIARLRARDHLAAAKQEERKRVAFFAIVATEVDNVLDSLTLSKEILQAVDPATISPQDWMAELRLAALKLDEFRSFEHDWDKIYIIGSGAIR